MLLTVMTPTADILGDPQEPDKISNHDSQLLFGEQFQVEQSHGPYVYGYSLHDGYKGYVERDQLVKNAPAPNATVTVKATHLYKEPNFKSRPILCLSFLSRLTTTGKAADHFSELVEGQWVYTNHINNLNPAHDLADVAMLYHGTPYRFGGRSVFGIDCSGLVQNCLMALGHDNIPRDSKDQEDNFGKPVSKDDLQRNDIVFFKGHVGIMVNKTQIINATARHMNTVIEELDDLEKIYNGITHIARI